LFFWQVSVFFEGVFGSSVWAVVDMTHKIRQICVVVMTKRTDEKGKRWVLIDGLTI
jgi:hypothetical protein